MFRLPDLFRGKFHIQHWLQLLAIIFCRQAKIRLLDKQPYTFGTPVTVLEALSVVHDWSTTNMGNRSLQRTVWQDRRAFLEHVTPPSNQENGQPRSRKSDRITFNGSLTTILTYYKHPAL